MSTHFYGRINVGTKAFNEAKKMPFLIKDNSIIKHIKDATNITTTADKSPKNELYKYSLPHK